eukprot:TRINITY_DN15435_c0_g1_i1.p1 TRINITY_DN15435_c0_g1~~TRINITY_DN15435_c0_g1_i1.p1  ORF type:complete len:184 (+),score=12.26 TRINITY_DN15435_c0_g1_i1:402-953(+)
MNQGENGNFFTEQNDYYQNYLLNIMYVQYFSDEKQSMKVKKGFYYRKKGLLFLNNLLDAFYVEKTNKKNKKKSAKLTKNIIFLIFFVFIPQNIVSSKKNTNISSQKKKFYRKEKNFCQRRKVTLNIHNLYLYIIKKKTSVVIVNKKQPYIKNCLNQRRKQLQNEKKTHTLYCNLYKKKKYINH